MSYKDILRKQLIIDEGFRRNPYRDTVGKLTIGVGRNLDDVGLFGDEIELMLANDIARAEAVAQAVFPSFLVLSDNRKAALANMAFNLGYLKLSNFHHLIAAVAARQWDQAANEMLNSVWATQVRKRADRLAFLMRSG